MKKKKFLFVVLGIIIFLTAANIVMGQENKEDAEEETDDYSKYDYKFTGESGHWEGVYRLEGEEVWYEDDEGKMQRQYWYEDRGEIKFKGELSELNSVKNLQIKVGSATSNLTSDGVEGLGRDTFSFGNHARDVIGNPEAPIEVEVIWDEETEIVTLVREDIE